jgi:outer membrane protein TolC
LPQITGGASGITSKGPSFSSSGAVASTASLRKADTTYQYDVTSQQLLFDGFKTSYDLSTAQRNIIASRYSYDVTSSNIRLRLRTAFANLLSAQELLKVAIQIRNRRKQNLELVRLRYEGGREHIGSLMTSEADLAQAEYEVRQAERAIYLSQRQLTKEMGRTFFSPMSAEGSLEVKETQGKIPDFEKLTATNPFLQQLIAEKDAARFGLKSAYSEFFPQVYASANIGNVNVNAFPDKNEYSYGMTMTFPLFEGGTRFANVSKAKATLGQAAQDERSGHDTVILTLSDTWTKLRDALDNIAVRRKYLEATEVRARIAEQEYAIGLMSFDNWIIIEDNLVSAKRTLVESQLTALTAEASWVQAKGGTLDYDQE